MLHKNVAALTRSLARAEAIIEVQKTRGPAGHSDDAERRRALTEAVVALALAGGMTAAVCAALGVSRATVHRGRERLTAPPAVPCSRPRPARALTVHQQQVVLDLLHAPRFAAQAAKRTEAASSGQRAQAPAEIYATLLDEGVYRCSIRTMYRILDRNGEVRERRQQLRHPVYQKPELLAEKPNEVWSWDITKLVGPTKWSYFYLYVILDIFSRRVVGWCVADAESATVFKPLFDDSITKHNVPPGQLTLHADRGGPMKAKLVPAQAGSHRVPAGRSGRHPLSQPSAHLQRQSFLRKPLQNSEVPATLPPTLRLYRGRQELLPRVLHLV